ncbi:MAG: hypothetical protein WC635_13045 [Bacteriovorax sp.]|jgi:hypothetical protein
MLLTLKKYFSYSLIFSLLIIALPGVAQSVEGKDESGGILDDSLKDISIVLGAGAAGAVLGLSTLSFVKEPSEHLKNIAVGAAVGIVVGVGVVIFSQATRSSSVIDNQAQVPMNSDKLAAIARHEFTNYKTLKVSENIPKIGYTFTF